MAEEMNSRQGALLDRAVSIADGQDTLAAIAFLHSQGDPLIVADMFSNLLRRLYFQEKNVPLMVMLGRAGIQAALAASAGESRRDIAEKLKGKAKEMAYNLGANTWPGWNDEGIEITRSDLAAGLDAARLNLRLARELNRGAEPLANAHWLMGAHRLAAGSHLEAVESFSSAAEQFRQADNRVCETMAAGYLGLAQMHSKQSRLEGKTALDAALRRLDEEGSENAEFFAAQLRTASEFFRNDAE